MKGKLLDISYGINRKQRITIEVDEDFRSKFDELHEAEINIKISKWREQRSKDANALFHVLVNKIAIAQGIGDDEVKRTLVVDYGTLATDKDGKAIGFKLPVSCDVDLIYPYTRLIKQVEENGKLFNCYLVYKRSRELDTKEMSRLIDGAIETAKQLGIDTDTPAIRDFLNNN